MKNSALIMTTSGPVVPDQALKIFMAAGRPEAELIQIFNQLCYISRDLAERAGEYMKRHIRKFTIAVRDSVKETLSIGSRELLKARKNLALSLSVILKKAAELGSLKVKITFDEIPKLPLFIKTSPFRFNFFDLENIFEVMAIGKWRRQKRTYNATLRIANNKQEIWRVFWLLLDHKVQLCEV